MSGDAVYERVEVRDIVTMRQSTELLGEHVTGKTLDDRVCLFAMLSSIKRAEPTVTVHVAATVHTVGCDCFKIFATPGSQNSLQTYSRQYQLRE